NLCNEIISPYGASKRAAEFFLESFHHTYGLSCTILRLFTVYGPRGRPDMAPMLFMEAIMSGSRINKFGNGESLRDYTYIDDIVEGMRLSMRKNVDFEIFNLGNNNPVLLNNFIETLEDLIGEKAKIDSLDNQIGDVIATWADITKAEEGLGWHPK